LKKNAAWCDGLGDYLTALEYDDSDLTRGIRHGDEKPIFLKSPLYEESSPCYKGATAESFAH